MFFICHMHNNYSYTIIDSEILVLLVTSQRWDSFMFFFAFFVIYYQWTVTHRRPSSESVKDNIWTGLRVLVMHQHPGCYKYVMSGIQQCVIRPKQPALVSEEWWCNKQHKHCLVSLEKLWLSFQLCWSLCAVCLYSQSFTRGLTN